MHLFARLRRARRPLYICHDNPDPDALCSAFLLSAAVPGDITVGGSDRPDMDGLLSTFAMNLVPWAEVRDNGTYDLMVIIDSFSLDQVEPCPERYVLVDHHATELHQGPFALAAGADALFHAEGPSCTWMIYEAMRAARVRLTREMAMAVICGLVGDTNFAVSPRIMQALGRLMEAHQLTVGEVRRAMDPLTTPDPEPTLDVLRTGQVIQAGTYKLFAGAVTDVRQSYAVRMALRSFGFDGLVLRLEMEGHQAVLYGTAMQHVRAGHMERIARSLRSRFPLAAHWPSGFTEVTDVAGAASEALAVMVAEFEGRLIP